MRKLTKKTLVVSAALMLMGTGSVAFAYWTNSGSGTGTATTGTNAAVTVVQTSTNAGMYPGGPPQTLSGNFNNPNAGATRVTAVTATGYTVDAASVTAGCAATGNYALSGTAPVGVDVPAGTAKGAWTGLTIAMNNTTSNQDACKNAVVTITYASS